MSKKLNGDFVLNFAPLLLNIPYQHSKLLIAINQIEKDDEIFFRVSYQIENESAGTLELEIENREDYKNGTLPVWNVWDKELGEIYKPIINTIGKQIEIFFKRLV